MCCPPLGAFRRSTSRGQLRGVEKFNRHYLERDYHGFAEFFFGFCTPEPHSTKHLDDLMGGRWTPTPEALAATVPAIVVRRRPTRSG